MKKYLLVSLAVAALGVSCLAAAAPLTPAEIQTIQSRQAVLLDAHLTAMKVGLKLDETQAQAWPSFEAAIRAAANARADRWSETRARMEVGERPSPVERLGLMADHLDRSAAELRDVAEAPKPLYDTLNESQKRAFGPLMREFRPANRR
jgi:zinc resistance-associated protein